MKSHGTKTDGVCPLITRLDRRYCRNVRMIGHIGQSACHGADRTTKIRGFHEVDDVGRAQVTRHIGPHLNIFLGIVDDARCLNLKDLRAEVGHDDLAIHWIMAVNGVNVDDVRITRLLLKFGNFCLQVAGLDLGLANLWIGHQFIILFSNVNVAKWYAVFQFNRVWTEEVHIFVFTS